MNDARSPRETDTFLVLNPELDVWQKKHSMALHNLAQELRDMTVKTRCRRKGGWSMYGVLGMTSFYPAFIHPSTNSG